MKVYTKIYVVQDSHGNEAFDSCKFENDQIHIKGLEGDVFDHKEFFGEARNLENWCTWHNFAYKECTKHHEISGICDEICDYDIATVEALHDYLIDFHEEDPDSLVIKNARRLIKKLYRLSEKK